jgi:phage/plasmid-associated DNA primase
VNEMDSWQVIPFMKGVAGTGKSTVIKVVQLMYNMRDIGVISNNIEKKFGLSTIFNKTLFVVPELKGDFAMDQADFQSMVTGEELSLAQKNKMPLTGQWTVPGIMAGNEAAGWEDKSGSISRRIVVFDFPNKVPQDKLNPNLINEIRDHEIPTIIRKAALAYRDALARYRGGDIWSVLPPRVCEEKKRLQYSTNPLYAFINSDNLVIDADEYTLESTFISKLKSFASLKFPNSVITFTPDFYSYIFSDFGLSIRRDTLPWPRSSTTNIQSQSYLFGCRINEDV